MGGTSQVTTAPEPEWEWCPECGNYFQGSHICEINTADILRRVEEKLDRILQLTEHGQNSP